MVAEEVRGRVDPERRGPGRDVGEEKAKEMLKETGFEEVERLPLDLANSYFVARKG